MWRNTEHLLKEVQSKNWMCVCSWTVNRLDSRRKVKVIRPRQVLTELPQACCCFQSTPTACSAGLKQWPCLNLHNMVPVARMNATDAPPQDRHNLTNIVKDDFLELSIFKTKKLSCWGGNMSSLFKKILLQGRQVESEPTHRTNKRQHLRLLRPRRFLLVRKKSLPLVHKSLEPISSWYNFSYQTVQYFKSVSPPHTHTQWFTSCKKLSLTCRPDSPPLKDGQT